MSTTQRPRRLDLTGLVVRIIFVAGMAAITYFTAYALAALGAGSTGCFFMTLSLVFTGCFTGPLTLAGACLRQE